MLVEVLLEYGLEVQANEPDSTGAEVHSLALRACIDEWRN